MSDWFRGTRFGVALMGLIFAATAAQSAEDDNKVAFSIPAQPLVSAISSYSDATGNQALYDASHATGRRSNNVQGMMTAAEGLDRLLIGTGLTARFVAKGRFVVTLSATNSMQQVTLTPSHRRYYGLVQQGVLDALCPLSEGRPGHYRMIVSLRVAASGGVERARRVGTAGAVDADQKIDAALGNIRFREAPPEGFAQPIRILLSPELPDGTPVCAKAGVMLGGNGMLQ
jgi:hypothetical protein